MLIEIESFRGDKILSGKKCAEKELRQKMHQVLDLTEGEEFVAVFCRLFEFEVYSLLEADRIDYVIDLDTRIVYAPRYSDEKQIKK